MIVTAPASSANLGPGFDIWGIALDLRNPDGLAALKRLIADADVLLFNIRPDSMGRLGLSYDEVAAVNPRIVYCGAYGFGEGGRYAGKPALDDLIQGAVALPSLVGRVTGELQSAVVVVRIARGRHRQAVRLRRQRQLKVLLQRQKGAGLVGGFERERGEQHVGNAEQDSCFSMMAAIHRNSG